MKLFVLYALWTKFIHQFFQFVELQHYEYYMFDKLLKWLTLYILVKVVTGCDWNVNWMMYRELETITSNLHLNLPNKMISDWLEIWICAKVNWNHPWFQFWCFSTMLMGESPKSIMGPTWTKCMLELSFVGVWHFRDTKSILRHIRYFLHTNFVQWHIEASLGFMFLYSFS